MTHWIADHLSVFSDIALLWVVPVLLVVILGRLFRLPHLGTALLERPVAIHPPQPVQQVEKRDAA